MNLFNQSQRRVDVGTLVSPEFIEVIEPNLEDCPSVVLPPEGNVKLKNYRLVSENIRAYTPTGDIHMSPNKGKLVPRFDICSTLSPPRAKILELLRPGDPGRDALEAIVRPAPRCGLTRPLDEDTRRFLQRALLSPSPQGYSSSSTPESQTPKPELDRNIVEQIQQTVARPNDKQLSLADELKEAEESSQSGNIKNEFRMEMKKVDTREAVERERLGKLALSVEEDEVGVDEGLTNAARRLDALLAESRDLHQELAGIQKDMQTQSLRACQCTAAARALDAESQALRFLDDVVALLKGDVAAAVRARAWPFAIGRRDPDRNYIV